MTETTVTETPEAAAAETSPAEEATPRKMHAFSTYLHVGPGASECESIRVVMHGDQEVLTPDGSCEDNDHFHAWCRLPNQFERGTLRDKAGAASARRLRLLRDPESDLRVILDGELEAVRVRGDREAFIEEIVGQTFLEDHLQALREIAEENEEYLTVDEDRERLRALEAMPADERPAEEFEHLNKHISEHTAKVNERREGIEKPKRESVKDKPIEELVNIVREQRIEALGNAARGEEYSKWEWYICTFKPKSLELAGFPNERSFSHINEFTAGPPEVLDAVATTITELEKEANDSLKG